MLCRRNSIPVELPVVMKRPLKEAGLAGGSGDCEKNAAFLRNSGSRRVRKFLRTAQNRKSSQQVIQSDSEEDEGQGEYSH